MSQNLGIGSSGCLRLPVHEAFSAQAMDSPNTIAVRHCDGEVTYGDLDDRANRLAHYLSTLGAGPEMVIGLCVERSIEMLVGVLGILKTGAAYLPLDPLFPGERLAYMLTDSGARIVLTQEKLFSRLPQAPGQVVCLDSAAPALVPGRALAFNRKTAPDDLAYVIYTSGTSGRPKGVMIEHGALSARLLSMQAILQLSAADRFLQRTSLSFDPSVEEIFWTLGMGARLILADPRRDVDRDYLAGLIAAEGVTFLDCVPTLLEELLHAQRIGDCTSLKWILCGGEALSAGLLTRCRELLRRAGLCNLYGPTEATISALYWIARPLEPGRSPPIGRVLPGTSAHILDAHGKPAPPGERGELYLGGTSLARGYIGSPELTAARFAADPFQSGARLYRTGDLACEAADGEIEFQGRTDQQVKLRGIRIEPGEIEAHLLAHAGVRQAVVIAHGDCARERRLVAYVAVDSGISSAALRQHLRAHLPEPMVPSRFILLDVLPLTPNGKIDRGRLPAAMSSHEPCYLAPHTPTQVAVAEIWATVLDLKQVGVEDDFFDVGGHSLHAVAVAVQVGGLFDVEVLASALFEAPKLGAFCERIDCLCMLRGLDVKQEVTRQGQGSAVHAPNIVPLLAGRHDDALFCIHGGDGGVSPYLPLARAMEGEATVYGVCAWEMTRRPLLPATVQELAQEYLSQIRSVRPKGPYNLLGWSLGALIAWEMGHQLEQSGESCAFLGLLDPWTPWCEPLTAQQEHSEEWNLFLGFFGFNACCVYSETDPFWTLGQDERAALVMRTVQAHGLVPPGFGLDDLRYVFETTSRLLCSTRRYVVPALTSDIDLFLPRLAYSNDYNRSHWPSQTRGECRIVTVAGDHVSITRQPNVQVIGDAVVQRLAAQRGIPRTNGRAPRNETTGYRDRLRTADIVVSNDACRSSAFYRVSHE